MSTDPLYKNLKNLAAIKKKIGDEEIRKSMRAVGLDKNGVKKIRALLLDLKENGTTILISSHYMEDIDALCDDVYEVD